MKFLFNRYCKITTNGIVRNLAIITVNKYEKILSKIVDTIDPSIITLTNIRYLLNLLSNFLKLYIPFKVKDNKDAK